MISTPMGMMSEAQCHDIFEKAGFVPPPGVPLQTAFGQMIRAVQQKMAAEEESQEFMHPGEFAVHRMFGVPMQHTQSIARYHSQTLDARQRSFIEHAPQFVIGALDTHGRPWASVLVGDFMAQSKTKLALRPDTPHGDPLRECLANGFQLPSGEMLWSAVAFDPMERSRLKLAGRLQRHPAPTPVSSSVGRTPVDVELDVDYVLGNCPKYISTRRLAPRRDAGASTAVAATGESIPLDAESMSIVRASDTFFVASRHLGPDGGGTSAASMDTNHRGGRAGFVRLEADRATLVWPEYSGNRFYSTLGNIFSDGKVGLAFPDYSTGDMLHVTGDAELLTGPAASAVMPRCDVAVRLTITGWVRISGGLAAASVQGGMKAEGSPYSPPIRPLASELQIAGRGALVGVSSSNVSPAFGAHGNGSAAAETAAAAEALAAPVIELVRATALTPTVATFEFRVPAIGLKSGCWRAGQFGVFDFSAARSAEYAHMNDKHPQSINDDLVRTWTLSAPPAQLGGSSSDWTVAITVRLVPDGVVSSLLHKQLQAPWYASCPAVLLDGPGSTLPEVRFLGMGGDFSNRDSEGAAWHPGRQLWIGAGVGVTPFMAMLVAESNREGASEVDVFLSLRRADVPLARRFAEQGSKVSRLRVFVSDGDDEVVRQVAAWAGDSALGRVEVHTRRIVAGDVAAAVAEAQPEGGVFACGPSAFLASVPRWLGDAGVPEGLLRQETFIF